jgi:uncharacterized protein with NRDE domain
MCLLMLAWQAHPRYRLVVAANRDEFHDRPAAPLAKWPPPAEMIAGRDLRAQGTWLGIDRTRRFGVITNFRELQPARAGAPSRGGLIPDYLGAHTGSAALPPGEFLGELEPRAQQYSGFNLLLSDGDSLWYASNRATPFARRLSPGVYGLSNELLDTPWPKLQRVRAGFESWLGEPQPAPVTQLFALLADRTPAASPPTTGNTGGLPADWARVLSAPFVLHPQYGTRSSTVVLLEPDGRLLLAEHRFDAGGRPAGETELHLNPGEWP